MTVAAEESMPEETLQDLRDVHYTEDNEIYANFIHRFCAMFADNIINALFSFMFMLAVGAVQTQVLSWDTVKDAYQSPALGLSMGTFGFLYFTLFESSPLRATPGKLLMGLAVTDYYGQRISFLRALGRNLGKLPSSILYIGYFMCLFTQYRQTLHDLMAGCLVIHHRPESVMNDAAYWEKEKRAIQEKYGNRMYRD